MIGRFDGRLLKPCPFCGRKVDKDLIDTLYPTGSYWRDVDGMRIYIRLVDRQDGDHPIYEMNCTESNGGCGVRIEADSKEDAVAKWNRRTLT